MPIKLLNKRVVRPDVDDATVVWLLASLLDGNRLPINHNSSTSVDNDDGGSLCSKKTRDVDKWMGSFFTMLLLLCQMHRDMSLPLYILYHGANIQKSQREARDTYRLEGLPVKT